MSKRAKYMPLTHKPVTQWIERADIEWSIWETRCATELGVESFRFQEAERARLSMAIQNVVRSKDEKVITIEKAKRVVRNVIAEFKRMNLPDHLLLNPKDPTRPSDFLMSLGFIPVADIFRTAMLETLDEAEAGKTVTARLAIYLALLRKNDCVIYSPRAEAIAAHQIRDVFKDCGLSTTLTSTRPSASGEGNEAISAFEAFVLAQIMPEVGSDPAARKILQRRLGEADRSLSH